MNTLGYYGYYAELGRKVKVSLDTKREILQIRLNVVRWEIVCNEGASFRKNISKCRDIMAESSVTTAQVEKCGSGRTD